MWTIFLTDRVVLQPRWKVDMKVVMIAHWTYHQIFLVIIAIINIIIINS